jgi:hypothetical protein
LLPSWLRHLFFGVAGANLLNAKRLLFDIIQKKTKESKSAYSLCIDHKYWIKKQANG